MTIVTLAEAKLALNKTTSVDDVELQSFIDGIVPLIEDHVGPVDGRTITETASMCDGPVIPLRHAPVTSVTSVTSIYSSGATWLTAALHVDTAAGLVRRLDRGEFYLGPFTVVYVAGRAATPANVNLAARLIVKHLWDTQRGASKRPSLGGEDTVTLPGWGFAIPNRAAELLGPNMRATGIA